MDCTAELVRSNKGGLKLIHKGYMYTVHKKRSFGGIRWRCTQRSMHCRGSVTTTRGVTKINMAHNHLPDVQSIAVAKAKNAVDDDTFGPLTENLNEPDDENGRRKRLVKRVPNDNSDYLYEFENFVDENDKIIEMPRLVKQVSRQATPTVLSGNFANTSSGSTLGDGAPEHEEEGEEVCIRWNSHHSNMKSTFPYLLQREQYVDVTLTSEGKSLKCHKLILSSCSGYFDELLAGIEPFQHPVIFLNGVPFWLLKAVLDFMYAGEVHIDQNKLPQLLKVAQMLQIKGLTGKEQKTEDQKPEETPPQPEKIEPGVSGVGFRPSTPKTEIPKPVIITKIPELGTQNPKPILTPKTSEFRPILPKPEIKPTTPPVERITDVKKIIEVKKTTDVKKTTEVKKVTEAKELPPKIAEVNLPLKVAKDEMPRLRVVPKKDVPFALTRRSIVFKAIPVLSSTVDPMSLLKTAFVEEALPDVGKTQKSVRDSPKKVQPPPTSGGKKVKKRKSSETLLSPPPVVYRKGTKSRPNVKVPRYYHNDYDFVLKKKMLKKEFKETLERSKIENSSFDLANVKAEPLDIEDTDVQFMEITAEDMPDESDLSRDYEATNSSSVDERSVTTEQFGEDVTENGTERFFKIEQDPIAINGKIDEEIVPSTSQECTNAEET